MYFIYGASMCKITFVSVSDQVPVEKPNVHTVFKRKCSSRVMLTN